VGSITENVAQFGGSVESEGPYYAVAPYNEVNAWASAGKLQVVVPAVQTPVAAKGNVDPASLVAVGKADQENAIYFYNVCGMLAIEIADKTVTEVCLQGGADNALAGKAVVAYSDKPSVESVSEASNKVTVRPEGEAFAAGTYYVSVLPGTLNGLTMTIAKGEEKTVVYTVPNDIVVERSVVRSVGKSTEGEYEYNGYITNVESLNAFLAKASTSTADTPVKGVILNDLDLSGATVTAATVLYGELDGKGHSIKNWENNAGTLIAENYGTVKNIVIDASCTLTAPSELDAKDFGVLITKQGDVGKCIGCKNYADISVTPTSMSETWRFAPLIGHNDEGYIEGCENHGDVTITLNDAQTENIVVGGVVGYCKGDREVGKAVAKNCKNFGDIVFDAKSTVKQNSIGGVVGATPVHASYKDDSNPSAFVNTGLFTGCVNSGDITYTVGANGSGSYTNMGGVIGYCEGDLESCTNSGAVTHTNSMTDASKACTRPAVGGVAGCVGYSMRNCSNSGKVVYTGYAANGTSAATFAGGYPKPAFGGVVGVIGDAADVAGSVLQNCDNKGEVEITCYMVSGHSTEPLFGGVAGYARVAVSGCDNLAAGKIAVNTSAYYPFVGGVIGRAWVNTTIESSTNAAILTLTTSGTATNQNAAACVGGITGRIEKKISGSSNSGAISVVLGENSSTSFNYIGGIAGISNALDNCTNSGNVTTTNKKVRVGGLAGQGKSTITGCSVIGTTVKINSASAASEVGGLAAYCNSNISNSSFSGTVDNASTAGKTFTGGLVAGITAGAAPTVSNTSLSINLKSSDSSGYKGLIYGGQYDSSSSATITLGTLGNTVKVLNTSTFLGATVAKGTTPLIGLKHSGATLKDEYVEFIDSLPTDNGSTTSAFQPASNWTGTWN